MVTASARRCPLCTGDRGRVVWRESGHRYLRCSRCGAIFADLSATSYAALARNAWDDREVSGEALAFYGDARARAHAQFLAACPPGGERRLLDVGCGLGFFLERARRCGWSIAGSDTSAPWAHAASERLASDRIRVGADPSALFPGERFDLVTAWDVLEHVHDPVPFLESLARCLRPGGRVFIRTPNAGYVLPVYAARRALRRSAELGPANHVVYYTARTMRRALRAADLDAVTWRAFAPPQVDPFASGRARHGASDRPVVRAKNGWSRLADALVRRGDGRVALGSDLDVFAVRRART